MSDYWDIGGEVSHLHQTAQAVREPDERFEGANRVDDYDSSAKIVYDICMTTRQVPGILQFELRFLPLDV